MKKPPAFQFYAKDWLTPNSYDNNYAKLPSAPGIYLFVRVQIRVKPIYEILYIGMSKNINKRCKNHEIKKICENKFGYIHIYFKVFNKNLRKREKELIKKFSPIFNLQHRIRGI